MLNRLPSQRHPRGIILQNLPKTTAKTRKEVTTVTIAQEERQTLPLEKTKGRTKHAPH